MPEETPGDRQNTGLPGHSVNVAFTNGEGLKTQAGPDAGPYLIHYSGFQDPNVIDPLAMIPAGIKQPKAMEGRSFEMLYPFDFTPPRILAGIIAPLGSVHRTDPDRRRQCRRLEY